MKKNYRHIWSEKRSLINVESHIRQYIEQRDIIGSTHDYVFIYAINGVAEEFHRDIDNQKWITIGKKYLKKEFFENILEEGKNLRKQYNLFINQLKKEDLSKLSDEKIVNLFIKSYQYHSRLRALFKSSRVEFLTPAENKLKKILIQFVDNESKLLKIFEELTTPSKLDGVNLEFNDWTELLDAKAKEEDLIIYHLNKYPWVIAHTYEENVILKILLKKLLKDRQDIKLIRNELEELKAKKRKLLQRQRYLLNKFDNSEINYLTYLFKEASIERMRLKGGWAGSDYLYLQLYKEISNRSNIILDDLYTVYGIDEVIEAIKKHKPNLDKQEKERRKKQYILWLKNGKLNFISGNKAKLIIDKELKQVMKKETHAGLKGQVASLGFAKGKVHVVIPGDISILDYEMKQFEQGEILVTPMTQPNMVPIMKKAAGIVTDEGGLTSHAAIIAREFKIPCVVGCEIATKILKNGDIVEVDAKKGIIKKIR